MVKIVATVKLANISDEDLQVLIRMIGESVEAFLVHDSTMYTEREDWEILDIETKQD